MVKIRIFWPLEGFRWGGVGGGSALTFWRPRPWYYVDKTCRGNLEDVIDDVGWGGGGVLTSWRPRPWYYVDKTCPKRSWWKIHTQSPCVPFSNTKSTQGLGVRTWASCPQRSFCGSSPKFGEQHSSLPAFCRREKKSFLPRVTAKETKIPMEFQWFQHRMEFIKWPFSLTAKYEPWT